MKFLYHLIDFEELRFAAIAILRLVLAAVLGAIIGYEREHTNRPAGIRTHTLVCLGAALVMITGEFVSLRYHGITNVDPTRLGAQVVSGIGFLGAGTILKEGVTVRGLTTAGSIWAVSCIGLAAGIGFYSGAIVTTALIYFTLCLLKKNYFHSKEKDKDVTNFNLGDDDFEHGHESKSELSSELIDDESTIEEKE